MAQDLILGLGAFRLLESLPDMVGLVEERWVASELEEHQYLGGEISYCCLLVFKLSWLGSETQTNSVADGEIEPDIDVNVSKLS